MKGEGKGGPTQKRPSKVFKFKLLWSAFPAFGDHKCIQFHFCIIWIRFNLWKKVWFRKSFLKKKKRRTFYQKLYLIELLKGGNSFFLFCRAWDGRIRTSEYRDQNPLPYHLATPHFNFYSVLLNRSIGCSSIPVQALKFDYCFSLGLWHV